MDTKTRDRLVKFLEMMASDQDGEALNAARMAVRVMKLSGLSWAQIVTVSVTKEPPRQQHASAQSDFNADLREQMYKQQAYNNNRNAQQNRYHNPFASPLGGLGSAFGMYGDASTASILNEIFREMEERERRKRGRK